MYQRLTDEVSIPRIVLVDVCCVVCGETSRKGVVVLTEAENDLTFLISALLVPLRDVENQSE